VRAQFKSDATFIIAAPNKGRTMKLLFSLCWLAPTVVTASLCEFMTHWTVYDLDDGDFEDSIDSGPCLNPVRHGATLIDGHLIGTSTMSDGVVTHTYAGCTITQSVAGDAYCIPLTPHNDTVEFSIHDVSRYVDSIIECDCSVSGGGDPHIKPWKGPRYFFMGECDAVFHSSENMDIHIRTTIQDFYSIIEAVAVRVGLSVLEMAMGDSGKFWVNGVEFSDADLPMQIEGKHTLRHGEDAARGTTYELEMDGTVVNMHSMKFLMAVGFSGMDASFMKGTGGLIGKFPTGELLARDGMTTLPHDGEIATVHGRAQPVNDAMGVEWQVRDTDHQLFREIREPAWPNKCFFPMGKEAERVRHRRLVTSVDVATASKTCAGIYEKESEEFDLCVTDVIAMNSLDVAFAF